jgi:hypothetical protein
MAIEKISSKTGFIFEKDTIEEKIIKVINGKIHKVDLTTDLLPTGEYEYDFTLDPSRGQGRVANLIVFEDGSAVVRMMQKNIKGALEVLFERGAEGLGGSMRGQIIEIPQVALIVPLAFMKVGESKIRIHDIFVYKEGSSPK